MRNPWSSSSSINRRDLFGALAVAVILGALLTAAAVAAFRTPETVTLDELTALTESGGVSEVRIHGDRVAVSTGDGPARVAIVADEAVRAELAGDLVASGASVTYASTGLPPMAKRLGLAALFLAIAVAGVATIRSWRKRRGGHFDLREPERGGDGGFDEVAGMHEAKSALTDTVAYLAEPSRFARLGGRPPRGILLTGEPGTGKTLLARAAADEAGVAFFSCSGSAFQEMYVGVGASRVRQLFAEARKHAPCIVFVDEIDALGKKRGGTSDGASSEHDQTLNQLLVEMDGFDQSSGIVVVATTNRPDILDPALVRPGRFDRQVYVTLPNRHERRAILGVHAGGKALSPAIDLDALSLSTSGMSGADLANLLNEAALLAASDDVDEVAPSHLESARDRVLMGGERPGMLTDPAERRATAIHEAGHAAVAQTAPSCDRVHKVSILPRARSLGVTMSAPARERLMYTRENIEDRICMLMGGRAAELEVLGTMTAGAADDLQRASELARKMVSELGMSSLGHLHMEGSSAEHNIDEEARRIVEGQLERARAIVRSRSDEVAALSDALVELDTVDRQDVSRFLPVCASEPSALQLAASGGRASPAAASERATA